VKRSAGEKPTIIVTTDVNGTTTPDNTFGELVRPDGLFDEMEQLMKSYTSGSCKFSAVLPRMKHLSGGVDRSRLESYAHKIPLYTGVTTTLDALTQSGNVDAKVALSTTGFAGLISSRIFVECGSITGTAPLAGSRRKILSDQAYHRRGRKSAGDR
jgi:phosphoserine phosphatase